MSIKLTDKSYLRASPESKISPPTDTKISELPINILSWVDFERLCLRLIEEIHSIDNCEIYGVSGSKQDGIDIFASKDSNKYECFQCKRYQTIAPGKLDEIVQEFKSGIWFSKSDKFFLCTSLALNSTSLQDKFNFLKFELKKEGIDFIKWDSVQLNRILKKHPIIVRNFFGDEWCRLFSDEPYINFDKYAFEKITKELSELKELLASGGQNTNKLNSIIDNVYDREYYWVESEKVLIFNKALEEYNATIVNKREKFAFSQKIIQSIFELSELKEIVDDWLKDSWSPENLDHLRFIHSGLLAYSCLEKIPKDVLLDLKLLNWCPIHHGFFTGHLASFIREIKVSIELKLDLVKIYSSDRYLFENLTRIINSLKKYLEFNIDELYVEKPKASIVRNLPKDFVLVVTSYELTLRNPKKLNQVFATLPLDKQLKVSKVEVVKTLDATIIVGINSRDCFYWNPEKDLIAHFFYHASEAERINNIFCKIKDDGSIETIVQVGIKIMVFKDFLHLTNHYTKTYLELTPFNSGFVGNVRNYANSSGTLIYQITEEFHISPLIEIETIRNSFRESKGIKEWLKLFELDEEISMFFELQNISMQSIEYKNEDLILLKGSTNGTGVLMIIQLKNSKYEILNILHLKESSTIAIDYVIRNSEIELYCAYLDLKRRDSVFEYIKMQNFNIVESKTICRERINENCRDIVNISVGNNGFIYLNEMENKILVYSKDNNDFEEFDFKKEEIHFMRYYN